MGICSIVKSDKNEADVTEQDNDTQILKIVKSYCIWGQKNDFLFTAVHLVL